jgi:signal transduction histidine kinase
MGSLIIAQEAERSRIARDLHDGVCQEIAAVAVDASYLRQKLDDMRPAEAQEFLRAIEQRAAAIAESVRRLSHGLHPSILHNVGLIAALQGHCAEVQRRHQLQITFVADEAVEPFSRTTALSLFRITQEALRNSTVHGRARHAIVSLTRTDAHLTLTISDDGAGFDVEAVSEGGGLGLLSIRERARLARGELEVRSTPGRGTTIAVSVPLGFVKATCGRRPLAPTLSSSSSTRVA